MKNENANDIHLENDGNQNDNYIDLESHRNQYVNHVSMSIHNNLLDSFSADYIYNTYVEKQHLIAKHFNFEPSDTVFLGYNYDKSLWGLFDRNDTNNRFGIAELLVNDLNFDEVTWISKKSK